MARPPLGISLRALARERGIRRKSVTLPAVQTTRAQSDALARRMVAVVDIWARSAREVLLPEYGRTLTQDSIPDLEVQIAATDQAAVRATLDFGSWFRGWAGDLSEWHLRKLVDAIFAQLKIDLRPFASAINDPAVIEAALARNVALVRSVSDDTRAKIADAIFRGQQAGTSTADVTKEISAVLGKSRDRARRIATDQTAKLGATLDQQRQEALGFTEFEWMHSMKLHYRPEHLARNGKVYSWRENDLNGDLPGVAPFCGCKAKAHLDLS
jgi:SPP1 gp7 family putative phage head morphogenesis protein